MKILLIAALVSTCFSSLARAENAPAWRKIAFKDLEFKVDGSEKNPISEDASLYRARFEKFTIVSPQRGEDSFLYLKNPGNKSIQGFLDFGQDRGWRMSPTWESFACEIDPAKLVACTVEEIATVRSQDASFKLVEKYAGGLWYRSFLDEDPRERRQNGFDNTFSTLSGGQAIAENLALDRDLVLGIDRKDPEGEKTFPITELRGVTVKPIPWEDRLPDEIPDVDPLSLLVPEDQHLLVIPSLQGLFDLLDQVEGTGMPLLQSAKVGRQYRDLPNRYRRQLGLDLPDALARFLPVKTVAVTGGDPFFPTGSDVAVLFETEKVDQLFGSLKTAISAKAKFAGAVEIDDAGLVGFSTPDRSFSSYLLKLKNAVAICNSIAQVEKLKGVTNGNEHALGTTAEYQFFRHRYQLDDKEDAWVFISDACLRRWSSPRIRIGASRRSRAIAALGEVTSFEMQGKENPNSYVEYLGETEKSNGMVLSENYGSLAFLKPIAELEIETVTQREKDGYEQWRRGYEQGWNKFFDPIAIRLQLDDDHQKLDLTILPLRVDSEYQDIAGLAGDATLSRAATTAPEESVFHFAMALDKESELFNEANVGLVDFLPGLKFNPLSWVGGSLSFSLGDHLFWQSPDFGLDDFHDVPILARVEVESRIKLALFLTALKGSIEASAPDLVSWETRRHNDQKYVVVKADEDEAGTDLSLYYAAMKTALLVSLNEDMLKRAIEVESATIPGLKGEGQVAAQASTGFLTGLTKIRTEQARRELSWKTLPILNEWRKSFGAEDPVAYHKSRFATLLTCPGGTGFRWNAEDLTMESIAYGHPGRPKSDAKKMQLLDGFKSAAVSADFEEGGLRLTLDLNQESNFKEPDLGGKPRPGDGEVIPIKDLLPSKPGLKLHFKTTTEFGGNGEPEIEKTVRKIQKVEIENGVGKIVWAEEWEGSDRGAWTYHYRFDNKGLWQDLVSAEDFQLTNDPDSPRMPGQPVELWPGQIRKVQSFMFREVNGSVSPENFEEKFEVIGWEELEIPSGEKLNALRVNCQTKAIMGGEMTAWENSIWYAEGLGEVRRETKGSQYHVVSELQKIEQPK